MTLQLNYSLKFIFPSDMVLIIIELVEEIGML